MEEIDNFWEELKFEIGALGKAYLNDDALLVGTGNREATILFIGDDPDLYKDENLRVGSGSSGEFLIKLCDIEGITPEDYYITTLTKKQYKFSDFMEEDKVALKELLDMQIALIAPKIIVPLGVDASEALLKKEIKIQNIRGNIIEWTGGIKIIPTYDVNFVKKSRNDSGKKSKVALDFWNDLKLIKAELDKING